MNDIPLNTRIDDILARFEAKHTFRELNSQSFSNSWIWNDIQDIKYQYPDQRLSDVLHIFHKEWHGIRAACGSLPGHKLAITEAPLQEGQIAILALSIREKEPKKIIFHGFSDNSGRLIQKLADAGLREQIYLVFHGSPAQWWNEIERRFAFEVIKLAQAGFFRSIHIMKNGMELPDVPLFKPLLYNISPQHSLALNGQPTEGKTCVFVPGWGNWIKNVFGSSYGASLSANVDEIWVYADGLQLPKPLDTKLVLLRPTNREQTFSRYLSTRITLNVSLIDCHPMVNVESQSLGRPCIRSDLNLDAYEDHDYVKLVSVGHNNSPVDIRDAVDRTLSVSKDELSEMITDYQLKMDFLALNRYCEFLHI